MYYNIERLLKETTGETKNMIRNRYYMNNLKFFIFLNHCHTKNERGPSSVCKKQPLLQNKKYSMPGVLKSQPPPSFLHFKDFYISDLNVLYWLNGTWPKAIKSLTEMIWTLLIPASFIITGSSCISSKSSKQIYPFSFECRKAEVTWKPPRTFTGWPPDDQA